MNPDQILATVTDVGLRVALQVLGAIIVFIVGRRLIDFAVRLISGALTKQHVDPTLLRYVGNFTAAALNIVLVMAILGYFGVETTTFAALVAAAGVAIGMAWSGLLAHFAAGAFLIVLRPFKVGDFVTAGGVTGTVPARLLCITILYRCGSFHCELTVGSGPIVRAQRPGSRNI